MLAESQNAMWFLATKMDQDKHDNCRNKSAKVPVHEANKDPEGYHHNRESNDPDYSIFEKSQQLLKQLKQKRIPAVSSYS